MGFAFFPLAYLLRTLHICIEGFVNKGLVLSIYPMCAPCLKPTLSIQSIFYSHMRPELLSRCLEEFSYKCTHLLFYFFHRSFTCRRPKLALIDFTVCSTLLPLHTAEESISVPFLSFGCYDLKIKE